MSRRKVNLELTVPQAVAVLDTINERLAGEYSTQDGRMLNRVRDAIIDALPEDD